MARLVKTRQLKKKLLQASNGKCSVCNCELDETNANLDHILPMWRGGSVNPDNLRIVCPECHRTFADEVLAVASNPSTALARIWIEAFEKNSVVTSVISAIAIALSGLAAIYATWDVRTPAEPAYKEQLRRLDATQQGLNDLSDFIQTQRQQLISDREALTLLQRERATLEPVVAADRQTVQAILTTQAAHAAKQADRERWIGFGLGVLSSLIASALVTVVRYFRLRRQRAGDEA